MGLGEVILEKKFSGHVHTLSKLNLGLIIFLGGISFFAREGLFFKLQPTFTGLVISAYLFIKKIQKKSLFLEMMKEMSPREDLPEQLYLKLEFHLALFLILFSAFMFVVALKFSTAEWLFWKTGGFYIASGIFIVIEIFLLKNTIKRKAG